ncbi:MAG: Lsm family RNA-binding protein [Candidatus Asgardarchaeia archaeon]
MSIIKSFFKELSKILNLNVRVITKSGRVFEGIFSAYDPDTLSLLLTDGKLEDGSKYDRIFVAGHDVCSIIPIEKPFDLEGLAEKLAKIFPPGEVKYVEEARAILVMDKVKVTPSGVEGSGPIADRVKEIFDSYVEEVKGK